MNFQNLIFLKTSPILFFLRSQKITILVALISLCAITSPALAAPEGNKSPSAKSAQNVDATTQDHIPMGADNPDFQSLVQRVDDLVAEVSNLTRNLKNAIDPEQVRQTTQRLNEILENTAKTIAPKGGLNQTAQRALGKLEDAIEQLRDMIARVNRGEGSVGMLLNDPVYAQELKTALTNINNLLNRVNKVRFIVDIGGSYISNYNTALSGAQNGYQNGSRSWFNMTIVPRPERYYRLGIAFDLRGKITNSTTTTVVNGVSNSINQQTNETTGLLLTAQFGQIFWKRVDVSIGALYGDGAFSTGIHFGPDYAENLFTYQNDFYIRTARSGFDLRNTLTIKPLEGVYFRMGLDSIQSISNNSFLNQPWFVGAGLSFDDEDIKILFALK